MSEIKEHTLIGLVQANEVLADRITEVIDELIEKMKGNFDLPTYFTEIYELQSNASKLKAVTNVAKEKL